MINRLNKQQAIEMLAMKLIKKAKKHGVGIAFISQCKDRNVWNFDTSGTASWTDAAADVFTSFAMDMLDEEYAKIDALLEDIANEDETTLQ